MSMISAPQPQHLNHAVPLPAITWILHNDCGSNVDLSTLANVCRSWREVCCSVLVAEATSLTGIESSYSDISLMCSTATPSLSVVNESEVNGRNNLPSLALIKPPVSTLRKLLLCDMARELIVQQANRSSNRKTLSSSVDGHFCLAWFAPSGIQITAVPLDADDDNDTQNLDEFKFDFARVSDFSALHATKADDTKGININGNLEAHRPRKKPTRQSSSSSQSVSCCHEWRGYRHAMEVLAPFGYATTFVRNVLDASVKVAVGNSSNFCSTPADAFVPNMTRNRDKPILTRSASELSQTRLSKVSSMKYNPTFCVRGATLARSEGFCLCLDNEYIQFAQSTQFEHPSHSSSHRVPRCIDDWLKHSCQHEPTTLYAYKRSERHNECCLSPRQRAEKQLILARALLPRLIMSTRRKCPILHRFAEEDADGNKGHRDVTIHDPHSGENANHHRHLPWEKRQRAVQFLNCDRSQAVKLITPPFHCGGVQAPITMFIVAITTEDGCFVSGRKSRFEFGHMYPLSNRDMMIDMSPICIATGTGGTEEDVTSSRSKQQGLNGTMSSSSSDHDDDDDDNSCNSDRSTHCLCKFDSCDPFHPKDITIDDPTEDCIHRGKIGPGLWHCYVAVFDGKSSFIRVDGQEELQQTSEHYGLENGTNDADNPAHAGRLVGSTILDGLTIGSDHHFDMSLCYGEIGGECGQGAISELAVFKGRLELSDITTLENYLMKKHGILSVEEQRKFISSKNATRSTPIQIKSHWEEDEWRRQAHALIAQRPPWDLVGKPVPLRVAANHSSVAWQRVDEITGTPMRVSRIGHKTGNGSSDW
ncbi:hypothetical protein HJC23_003840 [Cyclotella cryptica]|uniref:F-box domain-containing protein n=1 Tax=Cyclotella cryptica TaxID=29204 RepID=A0ABD3PZ34_9STRA|eukprot:CCRYP_009973-RA/>CCRYP_009973-RA protein AED:0.34 eAED:0.34 QI:158/1/1/1/0.4/0.33/6/1039/818